MIQRLQAKRNEEGFTLIELLIVIIVLGILAAIVVFAVGSTRKDSVASSCKTNYKSLELSAEAVNTNKGDYPIGKVTAGFPATNPLIAPQTGALLKAFPTSSDYSFQYVGTAGVAPAPSTFVINVFKNGVDKAPADGNLYTTSAGTTAATAATGTGSAQCDGL
jgi:general secretion pathway protein G